MRLGTALARSRDRNPALDGLRGLAALLVFLFHYGGGLRSGYPLVRALGYLSQGGWMGLDLFFALSGFLITSILIAHLGRPGALAHFYARRGLRILPLYWTALLAAGVMALAWGASPAQLRPLLVYAAFLQNVTPLAGVVVHSPPPLPLYHLWSLAVEEQFYLLWPVLILQMRTPRRVFWLCITIFVLSCAFRLVMSFPTGWVAGTAQPFATSLPVHASALAAGGALAAAHRGTAPATLRSTARWTILLSGTFLFAGAVRTGSLLLNDAGGPVLLLPAVHLLAAALVALCLCPGRVRSALSFPPLVWLGRVSYGFYVLHILLQPAFDHLAAFATHRSSGFEYQTVRLCCAFPITCLAAWMSFRLLEQPFLRGEAALPGVTGAASSSPRELTSG